MPYWLDIFSTGDNAWKTPDEHDRKTLVDLCERIFGEELTQRLDLSVRGELWKKVSTITIVTMLLKSPPGQGC